jgi:hypothetical protein
MKMAVLGHGTYVASPSLGFRGSRGFAFTLSLLWTWPPMKIQLGTKEDTHGGKPVPSGLRYAVLGCSRFKVLNQ